MSDLIGIGASAAQLYRQSLTTVSNNIANLNTEGYSRQEAIGVDNTPTLNGTNYLGNGSRLQSVRRHYDAFVEANLRDNRSLLSAQQPLIDYTERVVDIIGHEGSGLTPALDRFFSAAQQLSMEPASITHRNSLFSASQNLAVRVRALAGDVDDVLRDSGKEIAGKVAQFNNLSGQLASVNLQLARQVELERQPSNLLDQRDRLLHELSSLVSLDIREAANGEVAVKLAGSGGDAWVVEHGEQRLISVRFRLDEPTEQVFTLDRYGDPVTLSHISGGELGGLINFRSQVVSPLRGNLDWFASEFAGAVNEIHRNGMNLSGDVGADLFTIADGYQVFNSDGEITQAVRVAVTGEDPPRQLEMTLLGGTTWQVRDLTDGSRKTVDFGPTAALGFSYQGLNLSFETPQVPGTTYSFIASGRASGLNLAIGTPAELAVAGRLSALQPADNSQHYQVRFENGAATAATVHPNTLDLTDWSGSTGTLSAATNTAFPALRIPAGMSDFKVSFQPPVDSDQHLQLLGTGFAHVLGAALDPATQAALAGSGIYTAGTSYLTDHLNGSGTNAYLDQDFHYGFRANDLALGSSLPPQTNAGAVADTLIDAGDLTLNGVALGALNLAPGATLDSAQLAQWLNSHPGTGVTATALTDVRIDAAQIDLGANLAINGVAVFPAFPVGAATTVAELAEAINAVAPLTAVDAWVDTDGRLALRNAQGHAGENISLSNPDGASLDNALGYPATTLTGNLRLSGAVIEFGFGDPSAGQGHPADLSRLGLATGLYGSASGAGDFQVHVTGSGLSAELYYDAGDLPPPNTLSGPEAPLRITFISPTSIEIRDTTSDTLVSRQDFDFAQGVVLGDVRIRFDQPPQAGDVFDIQGNSGPNGDNRNLLALIALQDEPFLRGQTLSQFYTDQVSRTGTVAELARLSKDAMQVVYDEAVQSKGEKTGVNLDQEAADLIRFQQAYQAAAQIIQVANRLFDTMLSASG